MAKVGLSQSFYAIYNYDAQEGAVSYSGGGILGKAVEAAIDLDGADPTVFHANNGPAESAQQFSGGTLTITNDRLPLAPVAAVLGLEVGTIATPEGTGLDFPADMNAPYVGYGTITKMIVDNVTVWRAIILPKVQFNTPNDSATTQGETIEFSGHELTATIMRNDATPSIWKKYGEFATEANAIAWVKSFLQIAA